MRRIARTRVRYGAPFAVAGVVALAAGIPSLTAAASPSPPLPPLTPGQLIAKMAAAHVPAWHGTVQWDANLGLPSLGGLVSGNAGQVATTTGLDPVSLLSGTHQVEVFTAGDEQRLALPRSMAETDLVRVGRQAWLYDSSTQHVTHYLLGPGGTGQGPAPGPALTPEQVASRLVAHLGPSTALSVTTGPEVAGRPVYLLTLSPRAGSTAAAQTTLQRVAISVDAADGLPLEVSVYGKDSPAVALQVGYESLSFSAPAASNFQPPVGTSTRTVRVHPSAGARTGPTGVGPTVTGPAWAWVASFGGTGTPPSGVGPGGSGLQSVTTPVSGSFGTARLLHSNLLNALFLPDGRVLAGFVSPAVLESSASTP